MARPVKNSCDYFPHDAGMRNHKKVKAVRTKFGLNGYAIWVMVLEHLTGSDGSSFEYSDLEFELLSGDFGVSATEIRSVVDYCISLELLFNKNGWVNSESLDERLAPVFIKRGKAKELSKKQLRTSGKYVTEIPNDTVVPVTEMPQSKVNKSKVNEIKEKDRAWFESQFDEMFLDQMKMHHKGKDLGRAISESWGHLVSDSLRLHNAQKSDCKKLLNTWLSNMKSETRQERKPTFDIKNLKI